MYNDIEFQRKGRAFFNWKNRKICCRLCVLFTDFTTAAK